MIRSRSLREPQAFEFTHSPQEGPSVHAPDVPRTG
jgi:hypothetical protein